MTRTGSPSPERPAAKECPARPPSLPTQIGRFHVLQLLGQGAQGVVYLALDPDLRRKVAIKTLHPRGTSRADVLREARTVGRLRHPHIVPVFEVGEHLGFPYVVYEYVPGQSLKQVLRERGAVPVPEAIGWMLAILSAVEHAHGERIIHRDLNPANIQIGDDGAARIMDFGIAALAGTRTPAREGLWGTANYMAPELLDGGAVGPQTDLFSLGLILYEMVTGRPAVATGDAVAALYRIAHQRIDPPSSLRPDLGRDFDRLVMRALSKDPAERYPSAMVMQESLRGFLDGAGGTADKGDGNQSTLSFLLRRMRRRADFPAIAKHIGAINQMTAAPGNASVSELANLILEDYALTTKLLRLVNSSFYGQYGGHISTVTRAVVVLGFEQVRNAALSLLLFEHLTNQPQAVELRELTGQAFLSGNIGRRIASELRLPEPERAFICAMYHTLGEYLTLYYFPEEYHEILTAILHKGRDERDASRALLGLSFEELGTGVAREWRLPPEIVASLRRLAPGAIGVPQDDGQALRYIAAFANALTAAIARAPGTPEEPDLNHLKKRFEAYIAVDDDTLTGIVDAALRDLTAFARTLGVNVQASAFFQNAVRWVGGEEVRAYPTDSPPAAQETDTTQPSERDPAPPAESILLSGIQDITQALLCNYDVNDILVMVLETIFRGLGFTRVLLCIRDIRRSQMVARFGLGRDVDSVLERFRFPLSGQQDCFSRALREQKDLVHGPETSPGADVPSWYRNGIDAPRFALFPIVVNGISLGLIYADRDDPGRSISGGDLNYLNALRNQAALAIKQRS